MSLTFRSMAQAEARGISNIDASHYIKRAWRMVDGTRQLIDLEYHEPGFPEGYQATYEGLLDIMVRGGYVVGIFDDHNDLHGFAAMDVEIFGTKSKYMLLDMMFVSRGLRGQGMGKKLFQHCVDHIRGQGCDKMYICAGSAEDTIAFYRKMGCVDATEVNQRLLNEDPRDLQLEYDVKKSS